MSIARAEVEKVALLARLQLSDEELARMTVEMDDVLRYMDLLSELDTAAVEPMSHAAELANAFREDVRHASLPREAALANAPHSDGECFLVPPVLGEGS